MKIRGKYVSKETDDTLRDNYDFSNGVRGKYRHFIGQACTLKIHHKDDSVTTKKVKPVAARDTKPL